MVLENPKMLVHFAGRKISFYEDSIQTDGSRLVEAVVDRIHLSWSDRHCTHDQLDEIVKTLALETSKAERNCLCHCKL